MDVDCMSRWTLVNIFGERPHTPEDSNIFTEKVKYFGLGGGVVRWIEAYLTGRVSRVHVGDELNGTIPMHIVFPQGSVIGPLLFLLFLNDLPHALEALTLHFKDDVNMVMRR